jgi:hypothetical protein
MITIGSPLAIRNCAPRSIRNALVFYCYFSTAILLKVVVANENEINNVFLWSFKTEMWTKWTLRSFKKKLIVDSVQRRIAKNICSKFYVKQIK